jgi:hypothetical protein
LADRGGRVTGQKAQRVGRWGRLSADRNNLGQMDDKGLPSGGPSPDDVCQVGLGRVMTNDSEVSEERCCPRR